MRLLSICPRIRKESDKIIASTAWRIQILSLGAVYREVIVDPKKKRVTISSRYLWTQENKQVVRFREIMAVVYGYEDQSLGAMFARAHNSFDTFSVGLRLCDDTDVHLFSFSGEGTFANHGPLPDWWYWEQYALDVAGSQEKESRMFVDLLAHMIDVTVVPPRY